MPSIHSPRRKKTALADNVASRDWEFAGADTRYLTHALHRYSGKFIPQIARQLVELTSCEGDVVLDPYCGSGTTLIEAELLHRRAIGIDINPLATIIAGAKATRINPQALADEFGSLRSRLSFMPNQDLNIDLFPGMYASPIQDERLNDPWFTRWYQPDVLKQLVIIDVAIRAIELPAARRVAWIAFSDILRRSSNAHGGYPNVMYDSRLEDRALPLSVFLRRLKKIQVSIEELDKVLGVHGSLDPLVIRADASRMPLATESVDAIVTHPPYIASIPYAEYQQLSLHWLGYNHKHVDAMLTGGRRQSRHVVDSFAKSFSEAIQECARVLRRGGMMSMLLGDPTVRGEKIRLAEMAVRFAQLSGFALVTQHQRTGTNRRANLMSEETLLFFELPKSGLGHRRRK